MKFCDDTIAILKNIVTITPSIWFDEGNIVTVGNATETILVSANIAESFDQSFGIGELTMFLNTLLLFDEADIELKDNHAIISEGGKKLKYFYASKSQLNLPRIKTLDIDDSAMKFSLSADMLASINRAAGTLQLPNVTFIGDGTEVKAKITNVNDQTSNTFDLVVGAGGSPCEIVFTIDNFKMINTDYDVNVSSSGFAEFKSTDNTITYWLAAEEIK